MNESPDTTANDPLASAAAKLLRAWNPRSTAERTAFLSGLGDAGPELDTTALRTLRECAALSGAVAPQDLVRTQPAEAAARLLDLTSSDFDRTATPDGWRWTLRFGARQEALTRLVGDGRVTGTLEAVEELPTDPAGELLREIAGHRIAGEPPTVPPTAATPDAVQALSWARPLGGVAAELAELRRRSEVAAVREAYAVLLTRGVIGRDRKLAQLRAFAEAPTDPTAAAPPLASVVGVGGVGKSTVIAELIRPYLDRLATPCAGDPIVVVVDFDRVRFRGDAQLELSYEVGRQLGWAVPEAGADFSVLRYQQRKQRSESLQDTYSGSSNVPESDVRDSYAFDSEAGLLVDLHGLTTRPVLLVLDTFEEWQSRRIDPFTSDRNDPETRVWSWVAALHDQMRLRGLRVVVSGRADASLAGRLGAAPLEVPIDDLDPADAIRLLEALDVPADGRAELAELAGGNPLVLLVAARFFRQLPAAEQRAFLDGGTEALKGYTAELRGSVLYNRFLNHLPAQLRTLAHPGLLLRRITPTLVREVLAPHCGLAGISLADAEDLINQLADQVWLVKRTNTGLTHQPNIRRRMLQLMRDDPRQAETIRAINVAAAAWYGRPADGGPRREQELPPADADTEWFYHSLMVDPSGWERRLTDPTERTRWAVSATALGSSVEDLPDALRALLLYVRNDELTASDVLTLPGAIAQDWVIRHGENLIKQVRATEALLVVASSKPRVPELPWMAQAYCETGRWSEYWPVTETPELPNADPRRILWQTGRYAAINTLCSDDPTHWMNYRQRLAMLPELTQSTGMMPAELVERAFLELLATTSAPGVTTPAGNPSLVPLPPLSTLPLTRIALSRGGISADGPELFPVDQFRRMLVWLAGPPETPFGLRKIAGLLRPDLEWVQRFGTLIGLSDGRIAEQVAYLRDWADRAKEASRPSIDMVLGEINLRLVRLVSDQIEVLPNSVRASVRMDVSLLDALRGDNPELRPAITQALIEAARPDGPHLLAELAQSVLPIPVSDLEPQNLPSADDPRVGATLTQLVHVVDRSGALMPFLTTAAERLPGAEPVQRVLHAVRAWDAAHEQLFTALAASLAQ